MFVDGNVRIGVLPGRGEILIRGAGSSAGDRVLSAVEGVCASQAEADAAKSPWVEVDLVRINPIGSHMDNIGQILLPKGDLDGALACTQRAFRIFTARYGPDNPSTKTVAANLKQIEHAIAAMQH